MIKGLSLARTFYDAGHDVIGADYERYGIPSVARFSRVLRKFYGLPPPTAKDGLARYIDALLGIVKREKVQLWVSCSGVHSAVEDAHVKEVLERRSNCIAVQFDVETTAILHEKHAFLQRAQSLGLPVPESYTVTSRAAVHKVLNASPSSAAGGEKKKKKYILKTVDIDDARRNDMTLLPRRTLSETYQHLSRIPISNSKPWVLQQYIRGDEYCSHALVVHGRVKAFVACRSSDLLMHYEALPPESPLSKSMLRFTQELVFRSQGTNMTGHLSFDFLINEAVSEKGVEMVLQPIECNPRAHTAVVLFTGFTKLAAAYLSALDPPPSNMNGSMQRAISDSRIPAEDDNNNNDEILTPVHPARYHWLGHDIVTLLVLPLIALLRCQISARTFLHSVRVFASRLLFCKDGSLVGWDPLPWWWLYHGYWPCVFLACVFNGQRWSRVNVSTGRIFVL